MATRTEIRESQQQQKTVQQLERGIRSSLTKTLTPKQRQQFKTYQQEKQSSQEAQRKAEEQAKAEAQKQDTVEIGGKTYSRGAYEKAVYQLERERAGKKGSVLDTAEEKEIFNQLAKETGFFKRGEKSVSQAQDLISKGYTPTEAFDIAEGRVNSEYNKATITKVKEAFEKSVSDFEKSNPGEKLVFDQNRNLVGVESKTFGTRLSPQEYFNKVSTTQLSIVDTGEKIHGVPILKTIVLDDKGNYLRDANKQEVQEFNQHLKVYTGQENIKSAFKQLQTVGVNKIEPITFSRDVSTFQEDLGWLQQRIDPFVSRVTSGVSDAYSFIRLNNPVDLVLRQAINLQNRKFGTNYTVDDITRIPKISASSMTYKPWETITKSKSLKELVLSLERAGVPREITKHIPTTPGTFIIDALSLIYLKRAFNYLRISQSGKIKLLTGVVGSKKITSKIDEYRPQSRLSSFLYDVGLGALTGTVVGTAYTTQLAKEALTEGPIITTRKTLESIRQRPEGIAGFLVGGGLKKIYTQQIAPVGKFELKNVLTESQFFDPKLRSTVRAVIEKDGEILLTYNKRYKELQSPGGDFDFIKSKYKKYDKMSLEEFRRFASKNTKEADLIRKEALLEELRQELKLNKVDIQSIEYIDRVFSGYENSFVYKVVLKNPEVTLTKLKPGSDVSRIVWKKKYDVYKPSARFPLQKPVLRGLLGGGVYQGKVYSYSLVPTRFIESTIIPRYSALGRLSNLNYLFKKGYINKIEFNKLKFTGKSEIGYTELLKSTDLFNRAKKTLLKNFNKNEVDVLTPEQTIREYLMFKEGVELKSLLADVGGGQKILFGPTSRYSTASQQKFTDLVRKLERVSDRKILAKYKVDLPEGLAKRAGLTNPDIVFYKNFMREYLKTKKSFVTHLTSRGLSAETLPYYFKGEVIISASKKLRSAGKTSGLDVSPEVYMKGEIGEAGQIRGETIGYGGLGYLIPRGGYKGYTLIPQVVEPEVLFIRKSKISGRIFTEKTRLEKKLGRKLTYEETKKLLKKIELTPGKVISDYQSLINGEAQAAITPLTILKKIRIHSKTRPYGRLGGYKVNIYEIKILNPSKEVINRVSRNLIKSKNKNFKDLNEYKKISDELEKDTGVRSFEEYNKMIKELNKKDINLKNIKVEETSFQEKQFVSTKSISTKERNKKYNQLISGYLLKPSKEYKQTNISKEASIKIKENKFVLFNEPKLVYPKEKRVLIKEPTRFILIPEKTKYPDLTIRRTPPRIYKQQDTQRRKKPQKRIFKQKRKYILQPTISQRLFNVKRTKPLELPNVTGFEVARI